METKTRAGDANEFCLVLTPTSGASVRASAAVMERFTMLAEGTRRDLATVVAELVQSSVDHGPGRPITVTVALGDDAIHGEVSDQGNPIVAPPSPTQRTAKAVALPCSTGSRRAGRSMRAAPTSGSRCRWLAEDPTASQTPGLSCAISSSATS
jgi:hypothetical protein